MIAEIKGPGRRKYELIVLQSTDKRQQFAQPLLLVQHHISFGAADTVPHHNCTLRTVCDMYHIFRDIDHDGISRN